CSSYVGTAIIKPRPAIVVNGPLSVVHCPLQRTTDDGFGRTVMSAANVHLALLSGSDRLALAGGLAGFDESWHDGRLAERVALLPSAGPLHLAALIELIRFDLRHRRYGLPWKTSPWRRTAGGSGISSANTTPSGWSSGWSSRAAV